MRYQHYSVRQFAAMQNVLREIIQDKKSDAAWVIDSPYAKYMPKAHTKRRLKKDGLIIKACELLVSLENKT